MAEAGGSESGYPVEPDPGEPASPVIAVGVMVLIAVVAAGAVLGWAWLRPAGELSEPQVPDEVQPDTLAGGVELGEVPAEVAAAFDEPVIGARLLDEMPEDFHECDFMDVGWEEEPELEYALATPDGVHISLVGLGFVDDGMGGGFRGGGMEFEGDIAVDEFAMDPDDVLDGEPQRWRVSCTVQWDGRTWTNGGGSSGPADDPFGGTGGMGSSCCDEHGFATAEAAVRVPDGAAWVVQERGGWWLAYPVSEQRSIPVTWKFRDGRMGMGMGGGGTSTHVVFVDEDGEQFDETWVGM